MKPPEFTAVDATRETIKRAARKLFSEHGIDGVSTREILTEAGQRNVGALHYYFGSVDSLVRELIVDGAKPLDARRIEALDRIERDGGPARVREVIEVLVRPLAEAGPDEQGYLRFLQALNYGHRREFLEAIEGQWNVGWQRCLAHLRRLLPDMPPAILSQRFIFLEVMVGATMLNREYFYEHGGSSARLWRAPHTIENLIDVIQASLDVPPSVETLMVLPSGSKVG